MQPSLFSSLFIQLCLPVDIVVLIKPFRDEPNARQE